jgi:hypothetical protein
MKNIQAALALSFAMLVPCYAEAGVITNGDFETGSLEGWSTFLTPNGVLLPGIELFDVTGKGATYAAQLQVGEYNFTRVQEGGGISQTFKSSHGIFNISADIAAQEITSANGDGGMFSLMLDGVIVNSIDFGEIAQGEIKRGTLGYSGVLAAGVHDLSILVTRPYKAAPKQYIDNVEVKKIRAVPEPATAALFGIGLFGLASFKRRSKH